MDSPHRTTITHWFLCGFGLLLLASFLSIWTQADVLMGPDGLSPVESSLREPVSFWRRPSLLWLSGSPLAIRLVLLLGMAGTVPMMLGRFRRIGVLAAYVAYLSVVHAGGVFFQFQWDNLILETLLLCVLLPDSRAQEPHPWVCVAFRFLLFRLYLESGIVKVLWGTNSWQQWIAMDRYYETAPIPLLLGWWAHQLPHAWHVVEQVFTLGAECVLPFFFLAPPRVRRWAALPAALLQLVIALTASYGSFNILSLLLTLWLLDDSVLRRAAFPVVPSTRPAPSGWRAAILCTVSGTQMLMAAIIFLALLVPSLAHPWVVQAEHVQQPFRFANAYHLFADVTLERPTIEVQVSYDGQTFEPLHLEHAPGPLDRAPPLFIAPHHPRVAFQMWFFALSPKLGPWQARLLQSVCAQSSPVHAVFSTPPRSPVRLARFVLTRYRMTSVSTWWSTGRYWTRERERPLPTLRCPD